MKTTHHPLVGKFMVFDLTRTSRFGHFGGFVRAVDLDRKGRLKAVRVQLPGGPNVVTGKTANARCRGEKLTLDLQELGHARVQRRGRQTPALEYARG